MRIHLYADKLQSKAKKHVYPGIINIYCAIICKNNNATTNHANKKSVRHNLVSQVSYMLNPLRVLKLFFTVKAIVHLLCTKY